ncbi:hypothetical protein CU098_005246, partial [Rhizopus stolonifer]
ANPTRNMLVEKEDVVKDEVELFFGKVNELDLISGTEEKVMGLEKKMRLYQIHRKKYIDESNNGKTIPCNLLEEVPKFLLFNNKTNMTREDEDVMPDSSNSIFVYGYTYTLHGETFSTHRSGVYFYATCRISCDQTSFVDQVDNLKRSKITVVSENDLQIRKNAVVSYKKYI